MGAAAPDFYLRGDLNNWGSPADRQFIRTGDTYSLHVDALDGKFKIANADWSVNFGAATDGAVSVAGPCYRDGVQDGANFEAAALRDVDISFVYTGSSTAEIKFVVGGVEPSRDGLTSGTLPVLYINVYGADGGYDNEIISKDLDHKNYFAGEYWLDLNGCEWLAAEGGESVGSAEAPLPLEIKARGNYTRRAFAKKPFKLKLGAKKSLLGMTKSKHYAILAHADDDKGYMRNFTGFSLGRRIGLPWTPWQQPVEVVINGDYRGLYFLTESIRVGDGRVPVEELDDLESNPDLVSGGYVVELDNYDEDNQIRLEEKGQAPVEKDVLRVTFDTPEEYSPLQLRFITDQFTAINDLIGDNSDDVWRYLDIDDAARYYLVEEIISHTEAYHGSTYLFRDRGEGRKWHFSPLWDCGNAFNGPTDGFFYDHSPFGSTWIPSLRLNDRFNSVVARTWLWFMSTGYKGFDDELAAYRDHLRAAAAADHRRWDGRPTPADGQPVADNSDIDTRYRTVRDHLAAKIAWLKDRFGDYTAGTYAEPERDATPAAPLPEYLTAGIGEVSADAAAGTPVRYYNLQGQPVSSPAPGTLYITVDADGRPSKTIL